MRARLAVALCLALVGARACLAQRVGIWDAPVGRDELAAQPGELARLFSEHGYQMQALTTDDLLDAGSLSPATVHLLLIPTLGIYPHEGLAVLEAYAKAGGAFVCLGGLPFDRPLVKGGDGWELAVLPEAPPGEVTTIADFEGSLPEGISTMGGTRGKHLTLGTAADGGGDHCLRAITPDLQQYEYVTFDISGTGDETFSIVHFRARADEDTRLMGIEMNEGDGSRWKMVLPLGTAWREYTLYIPHFLSYATEGRGGPGDYLHPERLTRLAVGFITKMVGTGRHTICLDDVQRWKFLPPVPEALSLSRSAAAATGYYYGSTVKVPAEATEPPAWYRSAEPFEGATLQGTGDAGICGPNVTIDGPCDGWLISAPIDGGPALRPAIMAWQRTARVVPVLVAKNREGTELGPAAFVAMHHAGPLAGASWACFGLDTNSLLRDAGLSQAVLSVADYLARRPRLLSLSPTFGVVDGKAAMTLTATVAGPKAIPCEATVGLGYRSVDLFGGKPVDVTLAAADTAQVDMTTDAFDISRYTATADVSTEDGPADRMELKVNARDIFARLCDFLLNAQGDDGTFAGQGYVDERAARGLLAMYEMTGDERYRDAAIRWGEHELREQREDGGYRMGYGITNTGEACYVADGGEIAIGIARLAKYVAPARRQAYVDSLRRYFEYRESFRMPDGSIAVGWVLNLRWTQSEEGRRIEREIRSDRGVEFVIKCSLASASALPHLTGRPEDREMALRDARRFLRDNPTAYSTFGEAAQWAHYFIDDAAVRGGLARCMRGTLLPFVARPNGWWYAADGRSGVTLGALRYYYSEIDDRPEVLASLMRGIYHMVSDESPSGLPRVLDQGPKDNAEWRYLCYSAVSLAEVLRPLVTMEGIKPQ